jgi:hypothetical protein
LVCSNVMGPLKYHRTVDEIFRNVYFESMQKYIRYETNLKS